MADPAQPARRHREGEPHAAATTFILCLFVALVEGFDLQTAGIAGQHIGAEFGLTPQQLGWFFSSSSLGLFIGATVCGRLSDRFGRKGLLIASLALFGAFSIGTGLSHGYAELVLARFGTGLGLGGVLPTAIALTAEAGDTAGRTTRVSIMTGMMPLGGALCALYAVVNPGADWRVFFQLGGWAPLGLAAVLLFLLPESAAFTRTRSEGDVAPPAPGEALFGQGRARATLLLWGALLLTLAIGYIFINWLPALMAAKGYVRGQAAGGNLFYNTFGAVGGVVFGLLLKLMSRRSVFALAYVGIAVAALLLANATGYVFVIIAASLLGMFVNAGQFLLYGVAPTLYPTRARGVGVGAAVASGRIGAVTGPVLAATILASGAGTAGVLTAALVLGVVALAIALACVWRPSPEPA